MKYLSLSILFAFTTFLSFSQKGTVRGKVIDAETGETVFSATVSIDSSSIGAITDLDGAFSFKADPGTYKIKVSFTSYQTLYIENVTVKPDEVTILNNIMLSEKTTVLEGFTVVGEQVRNTEGALDIIKMESSTMIDGITSDKIKLTGDGNAAEAAKRITGVSLEGGKYIYVRGLGDRYTKTTLNGVEIPGLDPDRNSLQMDIFPTNLLNNIVVSKNFTADLSPAFAGGVINIETISFPDEKMFDVSFGMSYNPQMHFNSNFLTYEGGSTDFLAFDDGTRALPAGAKSAIIPSPVSGASDEGVYEFVKSFDNELGATQKMSLTDYSLGISFGNQIDLEKKKGARLGYVFSGSYKSDYKYYNNVVFGEYQKQIESDDTDLRYANLLTGAIGEQQTLIGLLGGLAYKTNAHKVQLTAMHLRNSEKRAAQSLIDNNGEAVGQSGYIARSNNLEYNQRSLTNVLLSGEHYYDESKWEINWKLSPTLSISEDPDIRKTAFTYTLLDTFFSAGAGGNPSRIWRSLDEINLEAKIDFTKEYKTRNETEGTLKFGASQIYKNRNYEILFYDVQFFGGQNWDSDDPNEVLNDENLYSQGGNNIYFQSGNKFPNSNAYSSNINNSALYVSNEYTVFKKLKTVLGLRVENYVQRHTGRDQLYASGDEINGTNLDNSIVLESIDLFPSANFIYKVKEKQNLRFSYGRTIARPSFKELSFAQILDPISNRIFNGSLFKYNDWDGNLQETRIDNVDLRWEIFPDLGEMYSVSAFYKFFDKPIELVRIPEQQTSTEYQPRNVGDGMLLGLEFEFKKNLSFISEKMKNFSVNGNVIFVKSQITMTEIEFNSRKGYEKDGETIENTRAMAGQSPYVINTGITYKNTEKAIQAGLFYNVKGPTLFIVGAGIFPDIYTDPFHSLNFTLNKRFGKDNRTKLDFKVSNILGDNNYIYYSSFNAENQPFSEFSIGRTFSLGLSHKF